MADAVPSPDGVLRVVSCSFLVPVKRIHLLIDALAILADRFPMQAIHWNHIGDGPLLGDLSVSAAAKLVGNINFRFVGSMDNRDVLEFYRQHPVDVFVNVSAHEGVPVSIMEAQSFAIPVVASAVGGTPEIVNCDNGNLLNGNPSAHEIADALAAFIPGSPGIDAKRLASKRTWYESYRAERNYTEFCRQLMSLDRATPRR